MALQELLVFEASWALGVELQASSAVELQILLDLLEVAGILREVYFDSAILDSVTSWLQQEINTKVLHISRLKSPK